MEILKTLIVADEGAVLDQSTGAVLGTIPSGHWLMLCESDEHLIGVQSNEASSLSLFLIRRSDLIVEQQWPLQQQFPQVERNLFSYKPLVRDGARMIFSLRSQAGSPRQLGARQLAAVDAVAGQVLWQTTAAASAPLYFVDDLADVPPEISTPMLLVDWQTGEQRSSDDADHAEWLFSEPHPRILRRFDKVLVLNGLFGDREAVIGADHSYRPLWRREAPLNSRQSGTTSPFRFPDSGEHAILLRGGSFEILDLRTGETLHAINAKLLGLESPAPQPVPPRGTSPITAGQTAAASSDSGVMKIGLAILALLAGYVLLRGSTLLRSK